MAGPAACGGCRCRPGNRRRRLALRCATISWSHTASMTCRQRQQVVVRHQVDQRHPARSPRGWARRSPASSAGVGRSADHPRRPRWSRRAGPGRWPPSASRWWVTRLGCGRARAASQAIRSRPSASGGADEISYYSTRTARGSRRRSLVEPVEQGVVPSRRLARCAAAPRRASGVCHRGSPGDGRAAQAGSCRGTTRGVPARTEVVSAAYRKPAAPGRSRGSRRRPSSRSTRAPCCPSR